LKEGKGQTGREGNAYDSRRRRGTGLLEEERDTMRRKVGTDSGRSQGTGLISPPDVTLSSHPFLSWAYRTLHHIMVATPT